MITPRHAVDAASTILPSRSEMRVDRLAFEKALIVHHLPRTAWHVSVQRQNARPTSLPPQSPCSDLYLLNTSLCTSIMGWRNNHHPKHFFSSCCIRAFCSCLSGCCARLATGYYFPLGGLLPRPEPDLFPVVEGPFVGRGFAMSISILLVHFQPRI